MGKLLTLVKKDELGINDIIKNKLEGIEVDLTKTEEHYLLELTDLLVRYLECFKYEPELDQAHAALVYAYMQIQKWENGSPWDKENDEDEDDVTE